MSTVAGRRRSCDHETDGRRTCGSPPWTGPTIATPWRDARWKVSTAATDRTRATSAPGIRWLIRSATTITTKTPAAMATDHQLISLLSTITERTRSMVVAPRAGTPRMIGIWRATISTAIPARMPVITGVEKNCEIHPSRNKPAATSTAPTSRAVNAIAVP